MNKIARSNNSTVVRSLSIVPPVKPQDPATHTAKSEPVFPSFSNFLDRTAEVFFMTEIW